DLPPDVAEPEAELRLRRHAAVNEGVPRPDPDHAAPRALADQRAELHGLEVLAEDVAVRAGELVGQRDHRAVGRILRPRLRTEPARLHVCEPPPRELLEQQRAYVPAAVEAHVNE